ncbi:V-type ATP synthase subunit I, partial [Bienertia sinuspersici]
MGQQVLCYHNEIAPLMTMKYHGPTKGNIFYGCSYWLVRDSKTVELEQEKEELKQKVKRLKVKKEKLQDEVGEMRIATTKTLLEMKENNTDK